VPEQIELSTLPEVKITRNGQPVDTSAIDNYDSFMAYLMTAAQTSQLVRIRKLEEDRKPHGQVVNYSLSITPETQEIICPYPCQSLYVENNGPGQIFVAVNSIGSATPVAAGREGYYPFQYHVIKRFFVWSAVGTVATATAILTY